MGDATGELDRLIGLDGVESRVAEAEARLETLLLGDASPAGRPSIRVAAGGGKRLRPALAIACASLGRPDWNATLDACVAVELVQVGSLVHDDIFEKAATRRGVPTINSVEGESHALMAGDYILARAAESAATSGREVASVVAKTVEELCIGQLMEMADLFDPARTVASHLESIDKKTASLFACSCRVGGICGGLDNATLDAVTAFGHSYGMAYQVLDDVLDLVSTEELLGKPVNIDIASGVYTLPVLLALAASAEGGRIRDLLQAQAHDSARDAVLEAGTIGSALDISRRYASDAAASVVGLPNAAWLAGFPERYVDWALGHFVA